MSEMDGSFSYDGPVIKPVDPLRDHAEAELRRFPDRVKAFVHWHDTTPNSSLIGDSRVAFDAQTRVLRQLLWYLEGKDDHLNALVDFAAKSLKPSPSSRVSKAADHGNAVMTDPVDPLRAQAEEWLANLDAIMPNAQDFPVEAASFEAERNLLRQLLAQIASLDADVRVLRGERDEWREKAHAAYDAKSRSDTEREYHTARLEQTVAWAADRTRLTEDSLAAMSKKLEAAEALASLDAARPVWSEGTYQGIITDGAADHPVVRMHREIEARDARIAELEQERDAAQNQAASAERELNAAYKELDSLRTVLRQLSNRHDGYEIGCGPCVCDGHVEARKILK